MMNASSLKPPRQIDCRCTLLTPRLPSLVRPFIIGDVYIVYDGIRVSSCVHEAAGPPATPSFHPNIFVLYRHLLTTDARTFSRPRSLQCRGDHRNKVYLMTPLAFVLPVLSWRLANLVAAWRYMGFRSFSLVAICSLMASQLPVHLVSCFNLGVDHLELGIDVLHGLELVGKAELDLDDTGRLEDPAAGLRVGEHGHLLLVDGGVDDDPQSPIMDPNLRISTDMLRMLPLNPRQLAKIMTGRPSLLKSRSACAVL